MRAVIQRVYSASVTVDGLEVSSINTGLLVLLGVDQNDQQEDLQWLASKIVGLRIFSDADQKMNLNISDVGGELLVVSQFTLFGATKKGNRPSFIRAAPADMGRTYYEEFCLLIERLTKTKVKRGVFGADMKVTLTNDGPVTLIIDSKNKE